MFMFMVVTIFAVMVKEKQRHTLRAPSKKHQNQISSKDEHDWVVVKKQRITILIPPLPNKVQSTKSNIPQESPKNTNSNETEKSTPLSEKQGIHPDPIIVHHHPSEPNLTFQNPPSLSRRNSPLDIIGTSKVSSKQMMIFGDSSGFFPSQRMRASYLEKKLNKAGGLENWLISMGLTRFVKLFERRRVNKFQLANLTMKKLKDMGVAAVGPRRKLMHSIDCLCEPHCFQHL